MQQSHCRNNLGYMRFPLWSEFPNEYANEQPVVARQITVYAPPSVSCAGYGFAYLSSNQPQFVQVYTSDVADPWSPEESDEALFTREDAQLAAKAVRGTADVAILGSMSGVIGESEDSLKPSSAAEELSMIGVGVRPSRDPSGRVRISEHLGIGPNGELQMVRSLTPEGEP